MDNGTNIPVNNSYKWPLQITIQPSTFLFIDTNIGYIFGHIEAGHNGQNGQNGQIVARLAMATNTAIVGVYGKNGKNVDHPKKRN